MDVTLFGTVYVGVLFAEVVGDKLLFGTGALAARFGARSVLAGALPALAAKTLAAVALGGWIAGLPTSVIAVVSCVAFAFAAYTIWRGPGATRDVERAEAPNRGFQLRGAFVAFTTTFFTEWADPGQLATAAFSARSHSPGTVWLAASAAMATKVLIALSIGTVVHRVVSPRVIRWAGVSLAAVLAIAAVID
ncbi:MAG TPA: TMEM165/GDT1 family protein [Gemmatimonadaceae bacterium]